MRAVGYVRVSTDEQVTEGISLDAQLARVTAYALLKAAQAAGYRPCEVCKPETTV
jgi:DNA invertase Pin-like site-specific DNA recombinase